MLGNKRALIDDFVPAIAVLMLGAVIFGMFKFNEGNKENKVKEDILIQKNAVEGHEIFFSYLKKIDDKDSSKIDLISKYATEKKYDEIKKDLQENLIKGLGARNYHIGLVDSSKNSIFSLTNQQYFSVGQYYSAELYPAGSAVVPLSGSTDYVVLQLSFVR